MPRTRSPLASKARATCEPMKPAAPVTRMVMENWGRDRKPTRPGDYNVSFRAAATICNQRLRAQRGQYMSLAQPRMGLHRCRPIQRAMEAHMRSAADCLRQAQQCERLASTVYYGGHFLLEAAHIWRRLAGLPPPRVPVDLAPPPHATIDPSSAGYPERRRLRDCGI